MSNPFSLLIVLAILCCLTGEIGCSGLGKTKKPPVAEARPPRKINLSPVELEEESAPRFADSDPDAELPIDEDGRVLPAANFEDAEVADFRDGMVVATVNGDPIFVTDLLESFKAQLHEAKQKLAPEDFRRQKRALCFKFLPMAIDQKLLAQAMKRELTSKQLEALNKGLADAWGSEVARMMAENKLSSRAELVAQMEENGISLEERRYHFEQSVTAAEFMKLKRKEIPKFDRSQVMEYYNDHGKDYDRPARVKWAEIRVSYSKHGGRQEAKKVVRKAARDLVENGIDYAEVARKYSDGATAESGGERDWTPIGSLAEKELEQALFELPIGDATGILELERCYLIAKVLEREEASRVPVNEVQAEIEKLLEEEYRLRVAEAAIKDLRESAIIETIFDNILKEAPPEERAEFSGISDSEE